MSNQTANTLNMISMIIIIVGIISGIVCFESIDGSAKWIAGIATIVSSVISGMLLHGFAELIEQVSLIRELLSEKNKREMSATLVNSQTGFPNSSGVAAPPQNTGGVPGWVCPKCGKNNPWTQFSCTCGQRKS